MKSFKIHGALDGRLEDLPVEEPGEGEVRVRVAYVGICGSDLHYYSNGANGEFVIREPLTPGHEVSGVVDLDPSGELEPGTPIVIHPAIFGKPVKSLSNPRLWPGCRYLGSASTWPHTQGGFTEYMIARAENLLIVPEGLPLKRAALTEPLSVAIHGVDIAGDVAGKSVLVSGSGPIGLLSAAVVLARGASRVVATDVLTGPLNRARDIGVAETVQIGAQELPQSEFDLAIECTGNARALEGVIAAVKPESVISQVGMIPNQRREINLSQILTKELQFRGTFCFGYAEFDEALQLLAKDPRFDNVITHVFPLAEAVEAFSVGANSELSGKVLVSPSGDK